MKILHLKPKQIFGQKKGKMMFHEINSTKSQRSKALLEKRILVESLIQNQSSDSSLQQNASEDQHQFQAQKPASTFSRASNEIFRAYGTPGANHLSNDEIGKIMVDIYDMIGKRFTPRGQDVQHFRRVLDLDGDGYVTREDLANGVLEKVGGGGSESGGAGGRFGGDSTRGSRPLMRNLPSEIRDSKFSMNTNYTFK